MLASLSCRCRVLGFSPRLVSASFSSSEVPKDLPKDLPKDKTRKEKSPFVEVNGRRFERDGHTNVTPKILGLLERKLHNRKKHPLERVKSRIVDVRPS